MNLRDRLREILPSLLPRREQDAIKGRELIARVRSILGDTYSDGSLRTQFSLLSLEEDTCLARISNGQGYYLRRAGEPLPPSLHDVFAGQAETADAKLHRAIALAVRCYDTAGLSVFAYPVEESWAHPDLVTVQWPAGRWGEDGAYVMEPAEAPSATLRAVCVGMASSPESCRQAFFRALACGQWAQEAELLLIGSAGAAAPELSCLATLYGVGVRSLAAPDLLAELPQADTLFRAEADEISELLESLPQSVLALPRLRREPLCPFAQAEEARVVHEWVAQCVERGRVEAYERRVAIT